MEDMDQLMQPPASQQEKEKLLLSMPNSTMRSEEKEEYMRVIKKFPNLFIKSHEEIRGFQCEPMHIEQKEGRAGLICPVEHSNWANPAGIIPKHT